MRRCMLIAAVLLATSLACRKQRASEPGDVSDTTTAPAAETPPAEPADTSTRVQDFGFDQRQRFAQSIRQQLSGIDQQIKDLAAQVDVATATNRGKVKQGVNRAVDDLTEAIESAQPK